MTTPADDAYSNDATGTATDAIDFSVGMEATAGDVELLKVVAQASLEELPEHMEKLGDAIDAKDARTINRLGHLIKGVCRNLGAAPTGEVAREIEKAGAEGDIDDVPAMYERLETEMARLTRQIQAFVDGKIEP